MTRRYAEGTHVDVERTRTEVQRLLRRYGASRVAEAWEPGRACVQFELGGLVAKLTVPLPTAAELLRERKRKPGEDALRSLLAQAERQRWRAFLLLLKAKLESIEMGVTSFEHEFLPHLMLENGKTVTEVMDQAMRDGVVRPLLPALPDRR